MATHGTDPTITPPPGMQGQDIVGQLVAEINTVRSRVDVMEMNAVSPQDLTNLSTTINEKAD